MALLRRRWALLLILYIAADLTDPSIPGVFVFDSGALFVDSVVQLKSSATRQVTHTPVPRAQVGSPADDRDETVKIRSVARPVIPPRPSWKNLKHDPSASSSPPDSSPSPLS